MELLTLELFAGAGGSILAGKMLGHRVVGSVEIGGYPRKIQLARQLDGSLPVYPIWDDVTTFRHDNPACTAYFDWLRSVRDKLVIAGGWPCQDISVAGKGAGLDGERSGLWSEYIRIVREVMPRYIFMENSPALLTGRGIDVVLKDLSQSGFIAEYGTLSAADVGAKHLRERFWCVARRRDILSHAEHERTGWGQQFTEGFEETPNVANANRHPSTVAGCGILGQESPIESEDQPPHIAARYATGTGHD